MTYLIPADKGTHAVLLALLALALLPFGWLASVVACAAAAIGREVYGRVKRRAPMTRYDWVEALQDIVAGMAGCALVLVAARVGL